MARIAGGTDTGLIGDEWIQQDSMPPKKSYLENIEEGSLWPDKGELIDVSIAGSSGYGSNYRHAGNVALLKNIISNKIATDTGFSLIDKPTRAIGDVLGGITGWGAGLKHELTAESPIFNENLTNGIFTTDFLEDMAANYYGAIHGKTGITSAGVVNEMAKALATGEDFDLDYLNKMGKMKTWQMNQKEFRKIFMDKYHKSPSEINRERLEKERIRKAIIDRDTRALLNWEKQKRGMPEHLSQINTTARFNQAAKRFFEKVRREKLKRPTQINIQKEKMGMPEHLTPPKIIPKHSPHGGGPGTGEGNKMGMAQGRDRGRARGRGETGQIAGGHHFNRGGLIDFYRYGGFVG